MKKLEKAICLAAFCAVDPNNSADDFDRLLAALRSERISLDLLEDLLRTMDEPQLLRRMARSHSAAPIDWSEIRVDAENTVYWREQDIGEVHMFHKTIFPQEIQARIAYEVFLDRFLEYVQREYKIALLRQRDADVTLFIPLGVDFELKPVWSDFVEYSFTGEALRAGFVRLVNDVRLTDSIGISTLDVPIVNAQQARILAAFYMANIHRYQKTKIESKQESGGELTKYEQRFVKSTSQLDKLQEKHPEWMEEINSTGQQYMRGIAASQLNPRGDIMAKAVRTVKGLAEVETFYKLDPILLKKEPYAMPREGGDAGGKFCYACGKTFQKGEKKYETRKFVFASPSQRPQSMGSASRPEICGNCALISLSSPIKSGGSDRLIMRLRHQSREHVSHLLENRLRMLAMGELGTVAGRYAMIRVTEQVPGKGLLSQSLGQAQYALYKVAMLFPPETFYHYQGEALMGDRIVPLPSRHLVLLNGLIEIFNFNGWWKDKGNLRAVGQAIRYVQKEEVISGVYTLIRGGLLRNNRFYAAQGSQLETLYEEYWRWLMNEERKEAQRFRDVAAMTGLLYAFCTYTRSEVRKAGGNVRIEVRKLIDRATEPFGFTYTAAGNTKSERAMLYCNADIYFCFDQARDLLEEIGVDVTEREGTNEEDTSTLTFYFDDVTNVYTYLFENRYSTPKAQRDFTNVLRMSLHSRFPELMEREKGE